MTLSLQARAVIGDEHPVIFAARHLGFDSVADFLEKAATDSGHVKPEVVANYTQAVEGGKSQDGQLFVPYFAIPQIERACGGITGPVTAVTLQQPKTKPRSKRRRRYFRSRGH